MFEVRESPVECCDLVLVSERAVWWDFIHEGQSVFIQCMLCYRMIIKNEDSDLVSYLGTYMCLSFRDEFRTRI